MAEESTIGNVMMGALVVGIVGFLGGSLYFQHKKLKLAEQALGLYPEESAAAAQGSLQGVYPGGYQQRMSYADLYLQGR